MGVPGDGALLTGCLGAAPGKAGPQINGKAGAGQSPVAMKYTALPYSTHLIICGTVTLEFSSKAFIMSPLQRMLSTHCEKQWGMWEGAVVGEAPRSLFFSFGEEFFPKIQLCAKQAQSSQGVTTCRDQGRSHL